MLPSHLPSKEHHAIDTDVLQDLEGSQRWKRGNVHIDVVKVILASEIEVHKTMPCSALQRQFDEVRFEINGRHVVAAMRVGKLSHVFGCSYKSGNSLPVHIGFY